MSSEIAPEPIEVSGAITSLRCLLRIPIFLHITGRIMLVFVAIILLSGRHRRMAHNEGNIMYALTLVDSPLTECTPALPEIELETDVLLHEALQCADPPIRDVAAIMLQWWEQSILFL